MTAEEPAREEPVPSLGRVGSYVAGSHIRDASRRSETILKRSNRCTFAVTAHGPARAISTSLRIWLNCWQNMVGPAGFEPATKGL
jgi:hypothetical protein